MWPKTAHTGYGMAGFYRTDWH